MWLLLKLLAAFASFIVRYLSKHATPYLRRYQKSGTEDRPWFIKTHQNKEKVYGTTFAVPIKLHSVFKLTIEGFWDRYFKSLGLAEEAQAGDRSFDERVYVACDGPAFHRRLELDPALRKSVLALFDHRAKSIASDGNLVFAYFEGNQSGNPHLAEKLYRIAENVAQAEKLPYSLARDPFVRRALFVEALVWSVFGYSIVGLLEWMTNPTDVHLNPNALVLVGLALGFVGASAAFAIVVFLMRGSSRGHRILVESAILLAFSLPMGGMHFASDLNRGFDSAPPEVVERAIVDKVRQVHRRRRGRKSYSYHLYLANGPDLLSTESPLPLHIRVSHSLFAEADVGNVLRIEVSPGFLQIPWYRSLTVTLPTAKP